MIISYNVCVGGRCSRPQGYLLGREPRAWSCFRGARAHTRVLGKEQQRPLLSPALRGRAPPACPGASRALPVLPVVLRGSGLCARGFCGDARGARCYTAPSCGFSAAGTTGAGLSCRSGDKTHGGQRRLLLGAAGSWGTLSGDRSRSFPASGCRLLVPVAFQP